MHKQKVIDWDKIKEGDPIEINEDNELLLVYYVCTLIDGHIQYKRAKPGYTYAHPKTCFNPVLPSHTKYVVDWSKVPVDTKITISSQYSIVKAHFSYYDNGDVYYFDRGQTSWSITHSTVRVKADYVTLYEEEEQ